MEFAAGFSKSVSQERRERWSVAVKQEESEYIKLRMARARDTLSEAELLLNSGYLTGSVNRIYYAFFYAVNALLFSEGLSSSKHSGVVSFFDRYWIKTGRLPLEMGKLYRQLFELRQEGDYRDTARFEQNEVRNLQSQAHTFIEQIADWLRSDAGVDV